MADWQPIETAPKDGTEVKLTWFENGEPQEVWQMAWQPHECNPPFQYSRGIWAMHCRKTGRMLATWTETDPDGAPTHWKPTE